MQVYLDGLLNFNPQVAAAEQQAFHLHSCATQIKSGPFYIEAEYRLIAPAVKEPSEPEYRTRNGRLIPFIRIACTDDGEKGRLPIREVMIGPQAPDAAKEAVGQLLKAHNYPHHLVKPSTITYRG